MSDLFIVTCQNSYLHMCYSFPEDNPWIRALDRRVFEVKASAYAHATICNRTTQIRTFVLFALFMGLAPLPVTASCLSRYLVFLSKSFKSYSSIRNYMDGVRVFHVSNGYNFQSIADNYQVNLVLKGLKRLLTHQPRRALTISIHLLIKIFDKMDGNNKLHVVLKAAFLTAFFGFLRKSSLLPQSPLSFNREKHLSRSSFVIHENSIIVNVLWSKTLQYNQKVIRIPLYCINNSPLCPVKALKQMFDMIPASHTAPAFVYPDATGQLISLSSSTFVYYLRYFIAKTGVDPSKYSGHSFRRSGCNFATTCGVSLPQLMIHGDWSSLAVTNYFDNDLDVRSSVMKAMVDKISSNV